MFVRCWCELESNFYLFLYFFGFACLGEMLREVDVFRIEYIMIGNLFKERYLKNNYIKINKVGFIEEIW